MLSNNKLLSETGFNIDSLDRLASLNAVSQIFNLVPNIEVGSTGPDTIVGSNAATDILIGGGGGDSLTAGSGNDILVSGPGGDGLPLTNHNIAVTVSSTPVVPTPTTASGLANTPIALTIDPSFLAALESDASLSLTISGIPAGATLGLGSNTYTPTPDGRVTFSHAQLANLGSLTITTPQAVTLSLAGTTNEGGVFTGGAGADTFILAGMMVPRPSRISRAPKATLSIWRILARLQSLADCSPHATQVGSDTVIDFTRCHRP